MSGVWRTLSSCWANGLRRARKRRAKPKLKQIKQQPRAQSRRKPRLARRRRTRRSRPHAIGKKQRVKDLEKIQQQIFRRHDGSKSSPLRISPWLHQAVEVALVCREGLRQALARRREAEGRAER